MSNLSGQFRFKVSTPWLLLTLVFVTFIWGNSLVPGQGSGSLSLSVMECAHEVLRSLGLPYAWLTNFIIRKTAHFTEYLCLVCSRRRRSTGPVPRRAPPLSPPPCFAHSFHLLMRRFNSSSPIVPGK